MILCRGELITTRHLIINESAARDPRKNVGLSRLPEIILEQGSIDLELLEQELIKYALKMANHNVSKTARLLGLSRATLRYRLEKYRISV